MEGHWKFLGVGGVLKGNILEAKFEVKLEFQGGLGGGGGSKTKNLRWVEYGYFVELCVLNP